MKKVVGDKNQKQFGKRKVIEIPNLFIYRPIHRDNKVDRRQQLHLSINSHSPLNTKQQGLKEDANLGMT